MPYNVVFITAPRNEAKGLARLMLKRKLCACVNIINGVDSFFWWKAKLDSAKESLLIAKTERRLLRKLIREVKAAHSYEVCEIIALPIAAGNKRYLDWITESCGKGIVTQQRQN